MRALPSARRGFHIAGLVLTRKKMLKENLLIMNQQYGGDRSTERSSLNHIKDFHLKHWQIIAICLIVYDIIAVNLEYFCALMLRFDFR